ncbi:hypothetical protein TNCV_4218041 [Trichonephila clavipes]|nr:hypothetical protein TNCV_4218041 [Trichonephila clavipes]
MEEAEKYYIIRGLKENRAIEIQLQSCSNIEELKEKMKLLDIQEKSKSSKNEVIYPKYPMTRIPYHTNQFAHRQQYGGWNWRNDQSQHLDTITNTRYKGRINFKQVDVLLDTGSSVNIIPKNIISQIKGYHNVEYIKTKIATINGEIEDSLKFINVNERNIKKKWASLLSVLDEIEASEKEMDQVRDEPDEIMDINLTSESKFGKSYEHETFESREILKCYLKNSTKRDIKPQV